MGRRLSSTVAAAFAASLVHSMVVCAVLAACGARPAHHCDEPTTTPSAMLSAPDCCAVGPAADIQAPLSVTVQPAPPADRGPVFAPAAATVAVGQRPVLAAPQFSPPPLYLSQHSLLI